MVFMFPMSMGTGAFIKATLLVVMLMIFSFKSLNFMLSVVCWKIISWIDGGHIVVKMANRNVSGIGSFVSFFNSRSRPSHSSTEFLIVDRSITLGGLTTAITLVMIFAVVMWVYAR